MEQLAEEIFCNLVGRKRNRSHLLRHADVNSKKSSRSQVALVSERIVGALLCGHDGRRGYLHHLAVDAEFRGIGIGRQLVFTCLGKLREVGIVGCNLFVMEDNPVAMEFWSRGGWSIWPTLRLMTLKIE